MLKIFSKLRREGAQLAFLQEMHLSAILVSNQIQYEHISGIKFREGRYVMIIGRTEGSTVAFFNIYDPPGSDWSFQKRLFNIMTAESKGILKCGGDMNIRLSVISF